MLKRIESCTVCAAEELRREVDGGDAKHGYKRFLAASLDDFDDPTASIACVTIKGVAAAPAAIASPTRS